MTVQQELIQRIEELQRNGVIPNRKMPTQAELMQRIEALNLFEVAPLKDGKMKLPPYGRELVERLRFRNPPLHAVVCVGLNAWNRAKSWHQSPDKIPAMVLPPDIGPNTLRWPVKNIPMVIEPGPGPSFEQLSDLALALLRSGAASVYSRDSDQFNGTWFRWAA